MPEAGVGTLSLSIQFSPHYTAGREVVACLAGSHPPTDTDLPAGSEPAVAAGVGAGQKNK